MLNIQMPHTDTTKHPHLSAVARVTLQEHFVHHQTPAGTNTHTLTL